jgi:hypothetical protein
MQILASEEIQQRIEEYLRDEFANERRQGVADRSLNPDA